MPPARARISGNTYKGVFAFILTLAILIFTEIIPKTLGSRHAVALAGPVAAVIAFLIKVLAPLVWMSRMITRLITPKGEALPPLHREELLAFARQLWLDRAKRMGIELPEEKPAENSAS